MSALPSDIFPRRLRSERESQGMSQTRLAQKISEYLGTTVDQSMVTRIEQQIRAVRLDEAVAIACALDVPLAALIDENPEDEDRSRTAGYISELVAAQHDWDRAKSEIERLLQLIHSQSMGHAVIEAVKGETSVDPSLKQAIDSLREDQTLN
jgi:transcriptional regulator with XRE-family HTH domain